MYVRIQARGFGILGLIIPGLTTMTGVLLLDGENTPLGLGMGLSVGAGISAVLGWILNVVLPERAIKAAQRQFREHLHAQVRAGRLPLGVNPGPPQAVFAQVELLVEVETAKLRRNRLARHRLSQLRLEVISLILLGLGLLIQLLWAVTVGLPAVR